MWSPGLKTTSEPWLGTANRRFAERPSRSTENDAGTKLFIKVTPEHSLSNPQSELAASCDPISLHSSNGEWAESLSSAADDVGSRGRLCHPGHVTLPAFS